MAEPDLIVAVKREDGESLVLNDLTLARAFFTGDPSSKPGGTTRLPDLATQPHRRRRRHRYEHHDACPQQARGVEASPRG